MGTPENSPTTPQCTLPCPKDICCIGELGADGRDTIVGGLSLNEAEQRIAPLLTSLLCVLHILLYFLIKCLEEFP